MGKADAAIRSVIGNRYLDAPGASPPKGRQSQSHAHLPKRKFKLEPALQKSIREYYNEGIVVQKLPQHPALSNNRS